MRPSQSASWHLGHLLAERASTESTTIRAQQEGPPRRLSRCRSQRLRAQRRYFTFLCSCIRLVHEFVGSIHAKLPFDSASVPVTRPSVCTFVRVAPLLSLPAPIDASTRVSLQLDIHTNQFIIAHLAKVSLGRLLVALPCGCFMHLRANTTGTSHSSRASMSPPWRGSNVFDCGLR